MTVRVYASALIDPLTCAGYRDGTQDALAAALTDQVAGRPEVGPRRWHVAAEGHQVRVGISVEVEP